MTIVKVNGVDYQIPNDKLGELITWLQTNKVATVLDNANPKDQGKTIINGSRSINNPYGQIDLIKNN